MCGNTIYSKLQNDREKRCPPTVPARGRFLTSGPTLWPPSISVCQTVRVSLKRMFSFQKQKREKKCVLNKMSGNMIPVCLCGILIAESAFWDYFQDIFLPAAVRLYNQQIIALPFCWCNNANVIVVRLIKDYRNSSYLFISYLILWIKVILVRIVGPCQVVVELWLHIKEPVFL